MYYLLGKPFENLRKAIDDRWIKQIKALNALKPKKDVKALKPVKKPIAEISWRIFSKKYENWWN